MDAEHNFLKALAVKLAKTKPTGISLQDTLESTSSEESKRHFYNKANKKNKTPGPWAIIRRNQAVATAH